MFVLHLVEKPLHTVTKPCFAIVPASTQTRPTEIQVYMNSLCDNFNTNPIM